MRKIVPGCKAVIVNSRAGNDDMVVRVIKKVEYGKDGCDIVQAYGQRWEVDCYLAVSNGDKPVNHVGEKQLERIFDYEKLLTLIPSFIRRWWS